MSNYKFNEELCRQLSNGDIAVHYNNGDLEMLSALLKKCAPKDDSKPEGSDDFYMIDRKGYWNSYLYVSKKVISLSDFIVNDSEDIENCNTWSDKTKVEFFDYALKNTSAFKDIGEAVEQFKASKQRKPLFKTEDWKQIFEGDEYWFINDDFSVHKCFGINYMKGANGDNSFSTEAAAREYVRLNKPMYSLNDVKRAWEKFTGGCNIKMLITELEKLKP